MTSPKRPAGETLPLPLFELVALLVAMTSVVALAIDMMLPALDDIAGDLGVAQANDQQFVITSYLAGFGAAQLFYGPLSDRFGRKTVLGFGLMLYAAASFWCMMATSFEGLLAARFLQGVANAAPRVIAVAVGELAGPFDLGGDGGCGHGHVCVAPPAPNISFASD